MASSQKKVSVQELTDIISQQAGVSKKFSEQFLRELIDVVAEYLERDGVVKVKGLGTFKLTWVDGRRSVDVSTGKEIVLPPHFKVGFTPETTVKQSVNEPYAHLDTVVTEIPDDLASGHDAPVADKADDSPQVLQGAAHDDDKEVTAPGDTTGGHEAESVSGGIEEGQAVDAAMAANNGMAGQQGAGHTPMEDGRGKRKDSKAALWIVVAAVLVALSVFFFISYDVHFPFNEGSGDVLVEVSHDNAQDDEAGDILDLSLADSLYADSIAAEESLYEGTDDSMQTANADPFESYTYETAMNAPVREHVTVIDGSRLTMVAYRAFGSKDFWVYVYDANRDLLSDPAEVEKGMVLKIPVLDEALTDPKSEKALQKARELAKQY